MSTRLKILAFTFVVLYYFLSGCDQNPITESELPTANVTSTISDANIQSSTSFPIPTISMESSVAPTELEFNVTISPLTIPKESPTPTEIPGKIVIPIASMKGNPPWLLNTFDQKAKPGTLFIGFNTTKVPFYEVSIRQALAASIDRTIIVAIAEKYNWASLEPATSFLPPQIIGRYLYNEVGIPFDPKYAKELLAKTGNTNKMNFPNVILYVPATTDRFPGALRVMGEAIVNMWNQHLGIEVTLRTIGDENSLANFLKENPNSYEMYLLPFNINAADEMDPSIIELFHSDSTKYPGMNYTHFNNTEFEQILFGAIREPLPLDRQLLYIFADKILCEDQSAIIPLFYFTR